MDEHIIIFLLALNQIIIAANGKKGAMDKITAQGIFKSQILGRWPDFELSQALYDDWINFIAKYTPDDICRAASQYTLNYDTFKRPLLSKFKDVVNALKRTHYIEKAKEERWPQYFLQQDDPKVTRPAYGTLIELGHIIDNPDCALSYAQGYKEGYEERTKTEYKLVVCKDLQQRAILLKDRSEKNRIKKENQNGQPKESIAESIRQIKDSLGSKRLCQEDGKEDVSQI